MPPFAPRWGELRATLAAVERWLLPGECLLCHGDAGTAHRSPPTAHRDADPLICASCRHRWSTLPEPQCPRCGQPLVPDIACRSCESWPAAFRNVRSAVWLDEAARQAVHLLKYAGWRRVGEALAQTLARTLRLERDSILIPIPLGAARLRSRGYNQSAVLARALGARLALPVWETALERTRDTAMQTALPPEARRANLAGAFRARVAPPTHPVLVDDVFTTGATLAAAASALLEAGAEQVSGVTFARAPRPLAAAAAAPRTRLTFWSKA